MALKQLPKCVGRFPEDAKKPTADRRRQNGEKMTLQHTMYEKNIDLSDKKRQGNNKIPPVVFLGLDRVEVLFSCRFLQSGPGFQFHEYDPLPASIASAVSKKRRHFGKG